MLLIRFEMVDLGNSVERKMYFGAKSITKMRARVLIKRMTKAEHILWTRLRKKQIAGAIFRRQHAIGIFIADFYCHEHKLIIEVDGEIHDNPIVKERDEGRTAELERFGLSVLRFSNHQIIHQIEDVIDKINQTIKHK